MEKFENFIAEGKVKKRTPNPEQAKSMFAKGMKRLSYALIHQLSENNADMVFEDVYDALREMLESFMANEGYKTYSHEAVIAFAGEFFKLAEDDINRMDRYRMLRNDSKYRGENITLNETVDIIQFVKKKIVFLKKEHEKRVK